MVDNAKLVQSGRTACLYGADVFSDAPHGGNPFTLGDLKTMVANFQRFSRPGTKGQNGVRFEVPAYRLEARIGHNDDQMTLQSLLGRTDGLAAGWASDLKLKGQHLFADIKGIPAAVAEKIASRELKYCSAEIDPNFVEAGQSFGPTIKRISFIGASLPRIRNLAPLPQPVWEFSEHGKRLLYTFGELNVMNREQMIAALQNMGCDTSTITDMTPDALLAEWLRVCESMKSSNGGSNGGTGSVQTSTANNSDGSTTSSGTGNVDIERRMEQYSERAVKAAIAPLQEQIKSLTSVLKPLQEDLQSSKASAKRSKIEAFCESQLKAGKILPVEFHGQKDATGKILIPSLSDRLMNLDDTQKIIKFSEGQAAMSALEVEMKSIEARPQLVKFTEKISQAIATPSGGIHPDRRVEILSKTTQGRAILEREKAKN